MWSRPTSCHRLMKSVLNIEFLDKIKKHVALCKSQHAPGPDNLIGGRTNSQLQSLCF